MPVEEWITMQRLISTRWTEALHQHSLLWQCHCTVNKDPVTGQGSKCILLRPLLWIMARYSKTSFSEFKNNSFMFWLWEGILILYNIINMQITFHQDYYINMHNLSMQLIHCTTCWASMPNFVKWHGLVSSYHWTNLNSVKSKLPVYCNLPSIRGLPSHFRSLRPNRVNTKLMVPLHFNQNKIFCKFSVPTTGPLSQCSHIMDENQQISLNLMKTCLNFAQDLGWPIQLLTCRHTQVWPWWGIGEGGGIICSSVPFLQSPKCGQYIRTMIAHRKHLAPVLVWSTLTWEHSGGLGNWFSSFSTGPFHLFHLGTQCHHVHVHTWKQCAGIWMLLLNGGLETLPTLILGPQCGTISKHPGLIPK